MTSVQWSGARVKNVPRYSASQTRNGIKRWFNPKEADGGWGKEYLGHLAWVMNARVALENQGSSGLSLSVAWSRRGRHRTPLGLKQTRGMKGTGWMRVCDNAR